MKTVCVLIESFGCSRQALAVIDKEDIEEAAEFLGCDTPVWPSSGVFGVHRPLTEAILKFSYKRLSTDKRWKKLPDKKDRICFSFGGQITDSNGKRLEIPFSASHRTIRRYWLERVTLFP